MRQRFVSRRFVLAGTAAAAGAAPNIAAGQAPVHLTVGTTPMDAGLGPVVGIRAGIYRRYGLDAELMMMSSGAAMAAAVAGGALHIGGSSLMGLISAHAKGIPFHIVAPSSIYLSEKPGELVLVRSDAPIRAVADLNGKTIASPALGDLLSTATLLWIDQNGGDSKSVRLVEVPSSAMAAALESGRIDAAAMAEPRISDALRSGNVRIFGKMYDAIGKRFLVSALFARTDFIDANRDTIVRLARAQREANAFANAHPDQTAPWLAEVAKVELQTIQHSKRELFAETLVLGNIQRVIEAAARYKVIERVFEARELISPVVLNLR